MQSQEQLLLSNALDALDRLYDGDSKVTDLQMLLVATGEALRSTPHFPHFVNPAAELLAVMRSYESLVTKRDRALSITDPLRQYLAELLPKP